MNIDEMEAGSELDALMAERVMGWYRRKRDGAWMRHSRPTEQICPECGGGFFHPSTDIAAALQVAEKVASNLHLWASTRRDPSGVWEVRFGTSFDPWGPWSRDRNLPLAICRAALKAVQYQEAEAIAT